MNHASAEFVSAAAAGEAAGSWFAAELLAVDARISNWIAMSDPEVRSALEWQFQRRSTFLRALTVFACRRASGGDPLTPDAVHAGFLSELFHQVSIVIDDIVARAEQRRGRITMHARFGLLEALMVAGYIVADGFRFAVGDPHATALFGELMKRLAVVETVQARLRRVPATVEDWRRMAGEATGTTFEVAAELGDRSGRLAQFGRLLGLLYHGCDDVAAVRSCDGSAGEAFTLPAAFGPSLPANTARLADPGNYGNAEMLAAALPASLPAAESYLDGVAAAATEEARLFAVDPAGLLRLVEVVRAISGG